MSAASHGFQSKMTQRRLIVLAAHPCACSYREVIVEAGGGAFPVARHRHLFTRVVFLVCKRTPSRNANRPHAAVWYRLT